MFNNSCEMLADNSRELLIITFSKYKANYQKPIICYILDGGFRGQLQKLDICCEIYIKLTDKKPIWASPQENLSSGFLKK